MCKKIMRILAWFLAAALAPILLLAAAIRVDQYVLRYRAERLQAPVRWKSQWRNVRMVAISMIVPIVLFYLFFLMFSRR